MIQHSFLLFPILTNRQTDQTSAGSYEQPLKHTQHVLWGAVSQLVFLIFKNVVVKAVNLTGN